MDSLGTEGSLHFAKLGHVADDGAVNVLLCAAVEGWTAGEENVSDDTNAPDVHTLVVRFLTHNFWRHIERGSKHLLEATLGTIETSESKVGQLQIELARFR